MVTLTAGEFQAKRSRRACDSLSDYAFKREGCFIRVTNRKDRSRSYRVHTGSRSCDCKDYTGRCVNVPGAACKHVEMVALTCFGK